MEIVNYWRVGEPGFHVNRNLLGIVGGGGGGGDSDFMEIESFGVQGGLHFMETVTCWG